MKHLFIALLISFAVFANLRVIDIREDEGLMAYTRFANDGSGKISSASLRLYIYPESDSDENLIAAKNFDAIGNSDARFVISHDATMEPGEYLLKAVVNHKDFRKKTRYAPFTVY